MEEAIEAKGPSQSKVFHAIESEGRFARRCGDHSTCPSNCPGRKRKRDAEEDESREKSAPCHACQASGGECDEKSPCAPCVAARTTCPREIGEVVRETIGSTYHRYLFQTEDGKTALQTHGVVSRSKPMLTAARRWRKKVDEGNVATLSSEWKRKYAASKKEKKAEIERLKREKEELEKRLEGGGGDEISFSSAIPYVLQTQSNGEVRVLQTPCTVPATPIDETSPIDDPAPRDETDWKEKYELVLADKNALEERLASEAHLEEARKRGDERENAKSLKLTTEWMVNVGGGMVARARRFLDDAAELKRRDDEERTKFREEIAHTYAGATAASQDRLERSTEMYASLSTDVRRYQQRMRSTGSAISGLMNVATEASVVDAPAEEPPMVTFDGQEFALPNLADVEELFSDVELPFSISTTKP